MKFLSVQIYNNRRPVMSLKTGSKNTEHLIRECPILNKQRNTLKNGIINEGGRWQRQKKEKRTQKNLETYPFKKRRLKTQELTQSRR